MYIANYDVIQSKLRGSLNVWVLKTSGDLLVIYKIIKSFKCHSNIFQHLNVLKGLHSLCCDLMDQEESRCEIR